MKWTIVRAKVINGVVEASTEVVATGVDFAKLEGIRRVKQSNDHNHSYWLKRVSNEPE